MSDIRVAIVEDDHLIREVMSVMLDREAGFERVGSYNNAEKFLHDLGMTRPDVVLMDIQLPGMSGIEAMREARDRGYQGEFMMCSVFEDEDNIFRALKAGASGYLLKSVSPEDLIRHIREIHSGLSPMSGPIARKVLSHFREPRMSEAVSEVLTKREKEILELLSKGYRYKEIADQIHLSQETVRTHIRNIYVKLQVDNRVDAINKVYGR
jgi:DNA-binding NarL/FixJ family response regulator